MDTETEASGLKALLSCDSDLSLGLERTRCQIVTPSEFWKSLGIKAGAAPVVRPADKNPLAAADWWRLESGFDA